MCLLRKWFFIFISENFKVFLRTFKSDTRGAEQLGGGIKVGSTWCRPDREWAVNDLTRTGWGGDGSSDKMRRRWLPQTHTPLRMCHVSAAVTFIGWSRDQVRSLKDLSTLRTASLHARVKIKPFSRPIKLNLTFLFSSFKSHTKTTARDSKNRDTN